MPQSDIPAMASNMSDLSAGMPCFPATDSLLPQFYSAERFLPPPAPTTPTASYQPCASGSMLAELSRAALDVAGAQRAFGLSGNLQRAIRERAAPSEELATRVEKECMSHATVLKEEMRTHLKDRLRGVSAPLSAREKSKLRSRREAKVHRVKEQAFESALKDALRWMIENSSTQPHARSVLNSQTIQNPHAQAPSHLHQHVQVPQRSNSYPHGQLYTGMAQDPVMHTTHSAPSEQSAICCPRCPQSRSIVY